MREVRHESPYHATPFIQNPKKGKLRDWKETSSCQGLGTGRELSTKW
jgi:hypothetical protein